VLLSITVRLAILTIAMMFDSVSIFVSRYPAPARHLREKSEPQCRKTMGEKNRDISGKISAYRCHDKPRSGENRLVATCLGRTVLLHVYYIQFSLSTGGILWDLSTRWMRVVNFTPLQLYPRKKKPGTQSRFGS